MRGIRVGVGSGRGCSGLAAENGSDSLLLSKVGQSSVLPMQGDTWAIASSPTDPVPERLWVVSGMNLITAAYRADMEDDSKNNPQVRATIDAGQLGNG